MKKGFVKALMIIALIFLISCTPQPAEKQQVPSKQVEDSNMAEQGKDTVVENNMPETEQDSEENSLNQTTSEVDEDLNFSDMEEVEKDLEDFDW